MGRHSAPDEDDDVRTDGAGSATDVLVEEAPRRGRHSAPEGDEQPQLPAATPEAVPVPARRGTNADLRMLRENPTLRARVAAAVVMPFLLYTAVLLVVGRTNVYLLWLWIPTVTAGVLAGAFMDRAARRSHEPESVAIEPATEESESANGDDAAGDESDDAAGDESDDATGDESDDEPASSE